jgi:transposase InsO family protein/transposase
VELHGNAHLCPFQRQLMCTRVRLEGWPVAKAAAAAGCSERTVHKWLNRFDSGEPMTDRSSRPHRSPARTPSGTEAVIETLRRLRMTGPQIAEKLQMPLSTVTAVLKRIGLNRLSKLEPPEPPNRYCRRHPGELIHIDIKKLGRFNKPGHRVTGRGPGNYNHRVGWEAVHVCVDDTSRVAYVEVLPDQKAVTCIGFLDRAIAWFAAHGIIIERVMTDNGSGYVSKAWAEHCADIELRHLRTRPYRPRTNGKAERFIQTMLREWAYAAVYQTSDQRCEALGPWLWRYNNQRLHSALGHKTPISRLHKEDD